ncbi:exodeoxyribonuclease V subunit alpha [Methylococcaceae bacterium CS1]|nr:exodeoxyribonuclease V subunit alpha [Methylococcaceae bacterium CS4]TXL01186.1 exodeoxyribonuclease V subunit alpha [Methylococcaceae bacterium CS5]TXL02881.1 exodeoxyribonuclease V subunit alpha [Methylococcaceae bacterium CS3]TXL03821.1 exodeoxyribonuclease V subunit alpha [Methylococcaceae bacterium CS1]TXL03912.1 exodeoxyribonuclease V subunit alpha [Methylococcaceae bacterium CS2]
MTDDLQFSRLDYAFASFLTQLSQLGSEQGKKFESIVVQLSYAQNHGHSCIEVDRAAQQILLASGIVDNSGTQPLVLEQNLLYLQRYWKYECQIAEKLQKLTCSEPVTVNISELINQYFPDSDGIDWQKQAAIAAVNSPFTIVTGGPGTGKTTTVVKILALLQELSALPLNIALAAPTGKAAMRLQESIGQSKSKLPSSELIKQLVPELVVTLHRLLGARPPSPYFKYNKNNPLPYDIVVIDEVSMIDLPLMSKLVSALKKDARLILLGDKDQLASVEMGTILADLTYALPEFTQELKKSYRFSGHIKTFSELVNQQESNKAWEILNKDYFDVCLLQEELIAYIVDKQLYYLQLIADNAAFIEVYAAFNEFQVLCANRQGMYSVEDVNYRVTQELGDKNLINNSGEWYIGRPVLITQNDAVLHLYNGDIGLCMTDSESNGQLMIFFLLADGSIRKYLPARLPNCETVFAMTIHKSQGSEFNEVLLLLPETINPILTKELIYTGITRARKIVKLVTNKAVFLETLQRKVERSSGLANRFKKVA